MADGPDQPAAPVEGRRERVFTPALVVFLAAVLLIDGIALWRRSVLPGPAEAIVLLGDGDLDGDERRRVLRALVDEGSASSVVAERWGALLAAVALEDREAHAAVVAALGGVGSAMQVPAVADREFLHLGDPLLGNIFAALIAEAEGQRAEAVRKWRQVETQCQLMIRPFAKELAAAALRRLE